MIPNHHITDISFEGDYLFSNPPQALVSRTLGGIALQDTSHGLNYQLWEIYYEDSIIKLKALMTEEITNVIYKENVSSLSLAFDLNMNLSIAYTIEDISFLYYYDTLLQEFSTLTFSNIKTPKITYDDIRETQSNTSDIVFAYINTDTNYLCYRLLRDRYLVEYPLKQVEENAKLIRVGMNKNLRLQFKIQLI